MPAFIVPDDETQRLESLLALDILDTPPEESFDRLTRLAKQLFNVNIVLVSLVGKETIWFKSRQGLTTATAPRAGSFCGHAILTDETLVVPDARLDARFAQSPLVVDEPFVRFYAGAPLRAENGQRLGTLCIIDNRPRVPSPGELETLRVLADTVGELLNHARGRQALCLLNQSEQRLRDIIVGTGVGTWECDVQTGATHVNARCAEIVGYRLDELMPIALATWRRLCHPDDLAHAEALMLRHLAGGIPHHHIECRLRHKQGKWVWVHSHGRVISRDAHGRPLRVAGAITDITPRKLLEKALADEHDFLQQILRTSISAITVLDETGRLVFANSAAEHILGFSPSGLAQRSYNDSGWHITAVDGQPLPDHELPFAQIRRNGQPVKHYIHAITRPDGSRRILSVNGAPLDPGNAHAPEGGAVFFINDITETWEANERVKQTQAEMDRFFASSLSLLCIMNNQGCYERVSESYATVLGYTAVDLLKQSALMFVHPDDVQETAAQINLMAQGGIVPEFTNRLLGKDGRAVEVLWSAAPDPLTGKLFATGVDVTRQRRAEAELRSSERNLNVFFTQSLAGFIVLTLDEPIFWNDSIDKEAGLDYVFDHMRLTRVNQAFLDQFGAREQDVLGMTPAMYFSHDLPGGRRNFRTLFDKGRLQMEAEEQIRPDGSSITIKSDYVCMYDAAGRLTGQFGVQTDITAALTQGRSLALSEARFRSLFELSPVGIALNDLATGRFVDVNNAFLASTGYTREECLKLGYQDVTPGEYAEVDRQYLSSLSTTKGYGPLEKEYLRKDGSRYPVLLRGITVDDGSGNTLVWSMIEDISVRKRNERLKNDFVSTVSHEWRTPLTAISGGLALVANGVLGELPEKAGQMIAIVHRNSQRLTLLINDLLDMDKLTAGKIHMSMQIQPVMPLIREALRASSGYAQHCGITLEPLAWNEPMLVRVDADRFQQVMANFLSNAIKFSPTGGRVRVGISRMDGKVRVAVIDQGPGVPLEFRERLFQKFSQADSSDSRHKEGSGLGLFIVKALAQAMNGQVGYSSVVGEGATFHIDLPLEAGDAAVTH